MLAGAVVTAAAIAVPGPGRRGGVAHRARVADIQRKLKLKHWKLTSGGSLDENIVEMYWRKLGRYPDLTFKKGNKIIAVQIGRREKIIRPGFRYRLPVARERAAIEDLIWSEEFDAVYFIER
jgi:hypothetical protein